MIEYPGNWLVLPFSEVVSIQKGKKPIGLGPKGEKRTIPYVNIAAFEKRTITEYAPDQDIPRCDATDTLLVWDGARSGLAGRGVAGFVGSTLSKITSDLVIPSYLFHFVNSKYDVLNTQTKGVGIPHINPVILGSLDFPLPPTAEQARIVEQIEEKLSGLDVAITELKAAQKKLPQFRTSLLKTGFNGGLTTEWRIKNKLQETGPQLLECILRERRVRWESKQLAKFKEQDKAPPKGWQEKYPEPIKPDTTDLPAIPDGWVWASVDQLSEFITSGSRGWAKYYSNKGAIFIRSQNINKDCLDLSEIAFVSPPKKSEGTRTRVSLNDLLLTITGANVGKAAEVTHELEEAYVSQHVALIRLIDTCLANYLHLFLTSVTGGRGQLDKEAYGAGKPGLNLKQVGAVVVPLPSKKEISVLTIMIAAQLKALSEQAVSIEHSIKQSLAQGKNILKSAFTGKLVPQDTNDEPASKLLERVLAEREEHSKLPRTRKTKIQKEISAVMKNLIEVLGEAGDWMPAQEAFRQCGVADIGSTTDQIEILYAELRGLDKANLLKVETVTDAQGRKQYDRLKLNKKG